MMSMRGDGKAVRLKCGVVMCVGKQQRTRRMTVCLACSLSSSPCLASRKAASWSSTDQGAASILMFPLWRRPPFHGVAMVTSHCKLYQHCVFPKLTSEESDEHKFISLLLVFLLKYGVWQKIKLLTQLLCIQWFLKLSNWRTFISSFLQHWLLTWFEA